MTIAPARYKQLRGALLLKAKSLHVPIPDGYSPTASLPPGKPARALITEVEVEAKRRGLYHGDADGTFNTAFQAYLVPPAPVDVNHLAAQFMLANLGPKENLGPNRGTWLNAEEDAMGEAYMHIGMAPWCAAIGGRDAYRHAGVDVRTLYPSLNSDYCPSWDTHIRGGTIAVGAKWRLIQVAKTHTAIRYGDILLFDWPGESIGVSDHFGRILSWVSDTALMETVEANTTSGLGGNQSDGGGIYRRHRSASSVLTIGRLVRLV